MPDANAIRCECDDKDVICPHCGASYQVESEDCSENVREEQCEACGKTYQVWQEFSVTHHTATLGAQERERLTRYH